MIMNRILILVLLASLLGSCAKITVVQIPEKSAIPADGVIYALPNTVIRLQVKVDKTEREGTRYTPYAKIFAPGMETVCKDEKCSKESKEKYSVQDGVSFSTYGEPDPSNVFLVKFSGSGAIDQNLSMTWNEAGLLSAASSSVTNRTGDVILSSLKLAAGLGTKAALGASEAKAMKASCGHRADNKSKSDPFFVRILQQNGGSSSDILIANYCSIKKEVRDALPQDKDRFEDAVRAFINSVASLASAREKILSGTSTSMEPATLLTHIEGEISQRLTSLFIGTKKTITWEGILDIRPTDIKTPLVVLRIDPAKGICLENSEVPPTSKPIPSNFMLSDFDCRNAKAVNLIMDYYPSSDRQLFTRITDIKTDDRSFRYRIPAQVKAILTERASFADNIGKKKDFGSGVFAVGQFGTIISLPADRHSKMLSYDLGFIETTGALKTYKLGTTGALDSATIDALSSVGGTLVDYRNTLNKNTDELSVLTRQDSLLKLRDDICTIQKKYGLPCTIYP